MVSAVLLPHAMEVDLFGLLPSLHLSLSESWMTPDHTLFSIISSIVPSVLLQSVCIARDYYGTVLRSVFCGGILPIGASAHRGLDEGNYHHGS